MLGCQREIKKLLIILAGVAILALTYFLIFIPQSNKRDSLKSENMNLKSQYNQLSALAAKADDYTEKTKDMSEPCSRYMTISLHIYR